MPHPALVPYPVFECSAQCPYLTVSVQVQHLILKHNTLCSCLSVGMHYPVLKCDKEHSLVQKLYSVFKHYTPSVKWKLYPMFMHYTPSVELQPFMF